MSAGLIGLSLSYALMPTGTQIFVTQTIPTTIIVRSYLLFTVKLAGSLKPIGHMNEPTTYKHMQNSFFSRFGIHNLNSWTCLHVFISVKQIPGHNGHFKKTEKLASKKIKNKIQLTHQDTTSQAATIISLTKRCRILFAWPRIRRGLLPLESQLYLRSTMFEVRYSAIRSVTCKQLYKKQETKIYQK